jgi:probable HAF family extracellular repeat protein
MAHVNPPRINFLFKITRSGRSSLRDWGAVLAILAILYPVELKAQSSITYIQQQGQDPFVIKDLSNLRTEVKPDHYRITGDRVVATSSGTFKVNSVIIDIPRNPPQDLIVQTLEPTGLPDASGSGTSMTPDGTCVAGYRDNGPFTPFHAFRWTAVTGSVDLGTLDGAALTSFATDTNQDCSTVVGFSDIVGGAVQHAFRWTQSNGMQDLNTLAGASGPSRALGVSGNGTVIVGDADFPAGAFTRKGAFRWTGGSFTDLIPGTTPSLATAVTGDGTVVVGQMGTTSASSAFRWSTQNPSAQPIGPLPGNTTAAATDVSDNGKIVVGISNPNFLQYRGPVLGWNTGTAFRWTQAKGIQDLRQILVDGGVDMTGITLVSVTSISPDGQWIAGQATTSQTGSGETVPFIVQVCDDDIGGPCSTAGGTAPFTLGASPDQLTVSAGQSGTTTITVTPNAGFTQPVTFSCGGLPVGAACSFNPPTVMPPGTVSTTLTISTNGDPVASLSPGQTATMFASLLAPVMLIPVGLLIRRRRSDGRLLSLIAGCVMMLAIAGMLSCSSSDSTTSPPATGTPAGTSNVTVTATSGAGSAGVPVALTVTRP